MIEGWPLVLQTLGVAAVATVIALPVRWAGRGHPFGSRASSRLAVVSALAIVALSTGAALVSAMLPLLVVPMKPLVVAFLLPFSTSVARVGRRYLARSQQTLGPALLTKLVSAGAAVLLDRLDTQMALDEDEWATGDGWDDVDPDLLSVEIQDLADTLTRLVHADPRRQKEIKRLLGAAQRAMTAADNAPDDQDRDRETNKAQQALLFLRGRAYEWNFHRHPGIDRSPHRPSDEPSRGHHKR